MTRIINPDQYIQTNKERRSKIRREDILPTKNDRIAADIINKIAFCKLTIGVFISDEKISCRDVEGNWYKKRVNSHINDLVGVYDKDIIIDDIVADLKAFEQDRKFNRIITVKKKRK